jgi:hypothetical protein
MYVAGKACRGQMLRLTWSIRKLRRKKILCDDPSIYVLKFSRIKIILLVASSPSFIEQAILLSDKLTWKELSIVGPML